MTDPFSARETFDTGSGPAAIYRLARLEDAGLTKVDQLPYSIRVLLEAVLRNCDGFQVTESDVKALAGWKSEGLGSVAVALKPARVILQDFTGVPCVVDLAAMRDAMKRLGGDPKRINPLIPVDLVIDHSVQVDSFASPNSLAINTDLEFQRNRERYEFLRWGQKSFANFSVLPPELGIIHQVNLEYLAKGVVLRDDAHGPVAFPDTLVGTDSHTPMINGLGVLGWGVGGIEAEAVMLGEPLGMLAPEVVGFELVGQLPAGATATDIVLAVTQMLRSEGVVGKFVEFFGEAVAAMGVADRALVSNMSPEYGATAALFPTDERTLDYLRLTGRSEQQVQLVERYCKENQLFYTAAAPQPRYTSRLQLDLSKVEPSLAGPKRPQDRVPLRNMQAAFRRSLTAPHSERGFELADDELGRTAEVRGLSPSPEQGLPQFVQLGGQAVPPPEAPAAETGLSPSPEPAPARIGHGAVVIAAITSCTNTSNPDVMLAAGLVAKKAVERGLTVPPYVKTSLAPGSLVVTDYYAKTGLDKP
ncbi:MAG: aconitate hydratase, partial [Thermoguttaceae bacterium]